MTILVHFNLDTERDKYQKNRNDSSVPDLRAALQYTPCFNDNSCYNPCCPYMHSKQWCACKKGELCIDYACSANHPPNRKSKCTYGGKCSNTKCSYLHPDTKEIESSYDDDRQNISRGSDNSCGQSIAYTDKHSKDISTYPQFISKVRQKYRCL